MRNFFLISNGFLVLLTGFVAVLDVMRHSYGWATFMAALCVWNIFQFRDALRNK